MKRPGPEAEPEVWKGREQRAGPTRKGYHGPIPGVKPGRGRRKKPGAGGAAPGSGFAGWGAPQARTGLSTTLKFFSSK